MSRVIIPKLHLCVLFTSLITPSALSFFVFHLSRGKISTTKDMAAVIEFVHVEKQYKPEKYLMPGILYTCQIVWV